MSSTFLDDEGRIGRLPIHIAERVRELREASAERGEHATAIELATLIEAVLSYLSRLWVAEYLHAGATDVPFNRELVDRLGRPMVLGEWVGIARHIWHHFVERARPTQVSGLAAQDFGAAGDADHPVSELLRYRNSFRHGSLTAVVEDIRLHRGLLETVLAQVPGLVEQPVRFRADANGPLLTATLDAAPAPNQIGATEPPLQPFIVGQDGTTVLRLYPLVYVTPEDTGYLLRQSGARETTHPLTLLFERGVLQLFYERYQHEQRGHLSFDHVLAERDMAPVSDDVRAEVSAALADDEVSLVVVEAYPGCGKSRVLASLSALAPESRYAQIAVFVVTPGDLGQSGLTFGRYLLRRAEQVLGRKDGFFVDDPGQLLETLRQANRAVQGANRRLLIGLEDLHFGYEAYRGEPLAVADVYRSLAGGAIHIVATTHPGRIRERLVFDRKIVVPIPDASQLARPAIKHAVRDLCPPEAPLRRRVLEQLLRQQAPLSLFALCEALEQSGPAVFEPAVERALWDLRPVLRMERSGQDTAWCAFSPLLTEVDLPVG